MVPASPVVAATVTVVGTGIFAVTQPGYAYACVYRSQQDNTTVAVTSGIRGNSTALLCVLPALSVTATTGLGPPLALAIVLTGPSANYTYMATGLGAIQAYNCSAIRTWSGLRCFGRAPLRESHPNDGLTSGRAVLWGRAGRVCGRV